MARRVDRSGKEASSQSHSVARRKLLGAAGTLLVLPVIPTAAFASKLLAVRTWPAQEYTRVTLELDSELRAEHFTLENPHRMVVDIQGLDMSSQLGELVRKVRPDDPYIQSLRVAQNKPNVVRIVFDLKQAIAPQVFTLKPVGDYQFRLVLDLYPKSGQDPILALLKKQLPGKDDDPLARILEDIGRSTPAPAAPSSPSLAAPSAPPSSVSPPSSRPGRKMRTITVAIDPGHGGEDPGAIGKGGTYEKRCRASNCQARESENRRHPRHACLPDSRR